MIKEHRNIALIIFLKAFSIQVAVSLAVIVLMCGLNSNKWDSNVRIFCYCIPAVIFLAQIVTGYIIYKRTVKELDKKLGIERKEDGEA